MTRVKAKNEIISKAGGKKFSTGYWLSKFPTMTIIPIGRGSDTMTGKFGYKGFSFKIKIDNFGDDNEVITLL